MEKNNLTWLLAIVSIAFLVIPAGEAANAASRGPIFDVFVANISPNPAEPGQNLLLNIILSNPGGETANNATTNLGLSYPFSLKTVQNDVSGKNICADCSNSIIYTLSVDANAISGIYPVEFVASYGSGVARVENKKTVNINVVGVPRLVFEGNTTGKVTPKSQFGVDFVFRNIGTGNAKNVKIITPSSDFVIAGGAPVISSLPAGESKRVTLNFISGPNIVPDVYSVPITLIYTDELGALKESTSGLGISVLGNSDLIVKNVKIEPVPVSLGKEFTITVRVQNIGYGDAKEVVMELDAPYSGYKKAFIGKLGKDEDAPAIFNLRADSLSSDAKLAIKYRDDFGEHEKTENISINVAKMSDGTIYYIVLIIAGMTAFAYRKRILKSMKGQSALYPAGSAED